MDPLSGSAYSCAWMNVSGSKGSQSGVKKGSKWMGQKGGVKAGSKQNRLILNDYSSRPKSNPNGSLISNLATDRGTFKLLAKSARTYIIGHDDRLF